MHYSEKVQRLTIYIEEKLKASGQIPIAELICIALRNYGIGKLGTNRIIDSYVEAGKITKQKKIIYPKK